MTITRLESPIKEVALHRKAKTKHLMFRKKPSQQGQEVQTTRWKHLYLQKPKFNNINEISHIIISKHRQMRTSKHINKTLNPHGINSR
jgi:hypothetical protein